MELGMIGLGRMGAAMVRRLLALSLEELGRQLQIPRAVWMMLPAGKGGG